MVAANRVPNAILLSVFIYVLLVFAGPLSGWRRVPPFHVVRSGLHSAPSSQMQADFLQVAKERQECGHVAPSVRPFIDFVNRRGRTPDDGESIA